MRVLLFTGKGGVGKTTSAAAAAALAAQRGRKTLLLSTDPAGSLADVLGSPVGREPTEVDTGLAAQQVDAQGRLERHWGGIQRYLLGLLQASDVNPIAAEELTVLPGAEEVLALLELREAAAAGRWDVLVVDCAPTGETLRLLALPEALAWYLDRVFPVERRLARTLRPFLGGTGTASALPPDDVFDAAERLRSDLADVRTLLTEPDATVRLVLTPESLAVAEARRTYTSLSLYGYRVDGVLVNKVMPAEGGDTWREAWVETQRRHLAEVRSSFHPLAVHEVPYLPGEPVGADALAALAARAYGEHDPFGPADTTPGVDAMSVRPDGECYVLSLPVAFAQPHDVELARCGDDLVVTVGGHRRVVALPSVLRRCNAHGAELVNGRLDIRFRPDPAQWIAS